jgi:Leucine-rich repeat (LRR) protein
LNEIQNLKELNDLRLDSNKIQSIKELENLTGLFTLYLNANQIQFVEGIEYMTRIFFLDLSSNQIQLIKSLSFDSRYEYVELIDFKMNKVKSLSKFTFANLSELTVIYLDMNLIETIETNSFYNLPKIQLISLTNNQIKSIEEFSFQYLNILFNLNSFGNQNLSLISSNSFSNLNDCRFSYEAFILLKKYDYSWFKMKSLDLGKNNIKVVLENTIKGTFSKLILSENLIFFFERNSFGYLAELTEINLSRNLIRKLNFDFAFEHTLPMLEVLGFSSNKIQSIEKNFFKKFPLLEFLDLSFNEFYSLLNSYFLNLSKLKHLDLSKNQILTIENRTFDYLENLIRLDLSKNLIYDLNGNYFTKLVNLKCLILKFNKIEYLHKENFHGLILLISLDLSHNEILSLQNDTFSNLASIKILKLSSNKLKYLSFLDSFKNGEYLDISFNNINEFSLLQNLSFLDLSHNINLANFNISNSLKVLNLSNTNSKLILNLKFSLESNLEELDLSLNNLASLTFDFFANLNKLNKINLRGSFITIFSFLTQLPIEIKEIDLSNNYKFSGESKILNRFANSIEILKLANTSLKAFNIYIEYKYINLKYLDLSNNKIRKFNELPLSLNYLNVSLNSLELIPKDGEFEIRYFMEYFKNLRIVDFTKSLMAKSFSNKMFFFNNLLECAYFTGNNLKVFPKFCQKCLVDSLIDFECKHLEVVCKLKELKFNSNNLEKILYFNLREMANLEYLDLENNSIATIELHSFADLIKLETLILSLNNLAHFNDTFIFSPLSSLKLLNLSSNQIEIIQSNLFDSLFKLETLDLSWNRIRLIHSFAFNDLLNLKNLHLNENNQNLLIESNSSFSHLNLIQNIYLSKSILNDENVKIFLNLFKQKTKSQLSKKVLGISFYKSLFLSSKYTKYDCNLTLYFISRNIHYNFKTETEIFDYFNECSLLTIKKTTLLASNFIKSTRSYLIFTDFGFYFFWSYLVYVAFLAIYLLIFDKNDYSDSFVFET